MNIAICDDNSVFLKDIENIISKIFSKAFIDVNISCYDSCYNLISDIDKYKFSLYFLDIEIGQDDGIELARNISLIDTSAIFIFVTSQNDRVYEVFSIDTFGFVRKSHLENDLKEVMDRLIRKYEQIGCIYEIVDYDKNHYRINLNDIEYIERVDKNLYIGIKHQSIIKTCYRTFTALPFGIESLVEIHRGVYVNIKHIKNIGADKLTLYSGKILPVSRRKSKKVLEEFRAYILD